MVWIKRLENDDSGDSTHLGGNNWDTLDSYFDNTDISASITNPTVINTATTFRDGKILFRNAGNTYSYTLKAGTLTTNADITLPAASGNITLIAAGGANDFGTEMQTFRDDKIKIMNPANTYGYIFSTSAITGADRTVTLPLLTGNDTLMLNDFTATTTNKTINIDQNTVKHSSTNSEGDILIYDSASGKYIRLARGTADQLLKVNSGGTDIGWETVSGVGEGTVNTLYSDMKTSAGFKYGLFNGTYDSTSQHLNGYGLLGAVINTGATPSAYIDTTNGFQGLNYPMTGGTAVAYGLKTSGVVTIGKLNPDIEICFQINEEGQGSSYTGWLGLTADLSETTVNTNTYLNSDIGIFLRKDAANNYFDITYNDGDATQHSTASVLSSDSNAHTVRFVSDQSVPKWSYSIDGAALVDLTTNIPAITDPMGVLLSTSYLSGSGRNFRVFWIRMKQKERV